MKKNLPLILSALICLFSMPSSFATPELILNPGIKNGEQVLMSPGGRTLMDPYEYCNLIKYCIYNVHGCYAADAVDRFSTASDANGVCIALGFKKALSWTKSASVYAFGQTRTYNSDGHLINITQKPQLCATSSLSWQRSSFLSCMRRYLLTSRPTVWWDGGHSVALRTMKAGTGTMAS